MTSQQIEVTINLPIWVIARLSNIAKKANIDALLSSYLQKVDKPMKARKSVDSSFLSKKVDKPRRRAAK
jgi:hypothetical protein